MTDDWHDLAERGRFLSAGDCDQVFVNEDVHHSLLVESNKFPAETEFKADSIGGKAD